MNRNDYIKYIVEMLNYINDTKLLKSIYEYVLLIYSKH